jgi:hypothetical protein
MAVELRTRLQGADVALPTLLFDHPTTEASPRSRALSGSG